MIRIKWVQPEEVRSGLEGMIEGGGITLVRGRADDLTEEHERAHIALGHHRHKNLTPEKYVRGELEAQLYTYRKLGKPKRLVLDLRGIVMSLEEDWGVSPRDGIRLLKQEFGKHKGEVPTAWKRDLTKLSKEYLGGR